MIYIGFIYGCILFCSMNDKRDTKHSEFELVVLSVVAPHCHSPLKGKEKGWTSGGVTECIRQRKPI